MKVLRTPDSRFEGLQGYPFGSHSVELADPDGGTIRMHFVDEGPRDGPTILMFHGNPDWSYSFRELIARFAAEGFRAIAPDMMGFGRSDKPVERRDHSIDRHISWLYEFVQRLDLHDTTLVCQDWGGTMGPGVVALAPQRFARLLVANGIMHTAETELAGRFPPGYSVHALNENERPSRNRCSRSTATRISRLEAGTRSIKNACPARRASPTSDSKAPGIFSGRIGRSNSPN
jgi:pimeloyl-ACP methyl ester carboxylesterase